MSALKQDTLALSFSNQLPVLGNAPTQATLQDDEKDDITPESDSTKSILPDHPEGHIPMKLRIMAFAFVLFFSTGAAFAEVTMGPLKSTLQRELGLNSTFASYIPGKG
jgi:hypothetical protein